MKSVKTEFPNPVLAAGRDDYIESCKFYTTFEADKIHVSDECIIVPITYSLECDGLKALIDAGSAVVVVSVKSSASSFSRLFCFPKSTTSLEISIPKFCVVKKIEFMGMLIASSSISGFKCDGELNELYFSSSVFEIRKGDILAREDCRAIYIDDSELEKPIASIFNINKVPHQADDIIPDFSGDKVEINLREELYDIYYHFKDFNNGSLRRYITGIIVYPVLIEAISKICEFYSGYSDGSEDKRWFRAIEKKCEKFGVVFNENEYTESYSTLADKLLGGISLDALKSFKDTLDSEMNDGETTYIGGVD